jgi:hypothetical protein
MKKRIQIIIPAIEEYLISRSTNGDRATHCFHPSELHQCPRKIWDSYMGVKYHTGMDNPRLQRVADNGHGVHERIQNYLKETGLLVDAEVPLKDDKYNICGHCDGIIRPLRDKEDDLGILEIKSMFDSGFRNLHKPKSEHVGQISLYMFLLDLRWGCLLYENKNDQRLTEFFVPFDIGNVLPILDKIKYVKKYIKLEQPPPRENKDSYYCNTCDHSECR